jgi:hypothetical protein
VRISIEKPRRGRRARFPNHLRRTLSRFILGRKLQLIFKINCRSVSLRVGAVQPGTANSAVPQSKQTTTSGNTHDRLIYYSARENGCHLR